MSLCRYRTRQRGGGGGGGLRHSQLYTGLPQHTVLYGFGSLIVATYCMCRQIDGSLLNYSIDNALAMEWHCKHVSLAIGLLFGNVVIGKYIWQWNPYVRLSGKHAYLAIGLLFGNVVTGFIKGNCPLKFVAISLLACYWMATGLLLAIPNYTV